MYTYDGRIRYSEVDETQHLTILGMVNYLQDASTFHSAEVGESINAFEEKHRAWLLSYWDLEVLRLPELYETIVIGTCPVSTHGILADRNFWIQKNDEYLVKARSIWFLMDTERGRPVRIAEEDIAPYGERRDVLGMPDNGRKVALPETMKAGKPVLIERHHIDTNHHVNNAWYIQIADDCLAAAYGERFMAGQIRAEYAKAAVQGETFYPYYGELPDGSRVVSLRNSEDMTYCNILFKARS